MYIALELGDLNLAFPVHSVWEVIDRGEIVPVPNSLSFVEGVRLYRNQLVPVYNLLRTELFTSSSSKSFDFILLLQYHDAYNGFLGTAVRTLSDTPKAAAEEKLRLSLDKDLGKEYFIADGKRHYVVDEKDLYRQLKITDEALN